jgi:protein O-GlcNAc transferase
MEGSSGDEAMALFRRGEKFRQFGELGAAKEALLAALEEDAMFAEAWNLLGLVHQQAWSLDEARKCFAKAANLKSKWLEPLLHLGLLEFSMGLYKEAFHTLQRYSDLGGEDIEALLAFARTANQLDKFKAVLEITSRILDVDDDIYEAWELRGVCQAKISRYNAACVSLNMAIDLHPGSLTALNKVGDICYEAGNYERACDFYESSLDHKEKQPEIIFRCGTSLWFVDRWADAIPYLETYTILAPQDPRGWNNLGVVLREKGDVKRAIECYNRALSLDSGLEAALRNMNTAKDMQMLL